MQMIHALPVHPYAILSVERSQWQAFSFDSQSLIGAWPPNFSFEQHIISHMLHSMLKCFSRGLL
jgi:hypothetical protein